MPRHNLLSHMVTGAIVADLVVLGGFYLWLHRQYTIGVDPSFGFLALAVAGLVGAAVGYAVLVIRRATNGR
jgi:hypothetical protein